MSDPKPAHTFVVGEALKEGEVVTFDEEKGVLRKVFDPEAPNPLLVADYETTEMRTLSVLGKMPGDLKKGYEELRKELGASPTGRLVDYADLLRPSNGTGPAYYEEMKGIHQDLKAFVAAQPGKEHLEASLIRYEPIADVVEIEVDLRGQLRQIYEGVMRFRVAMNGAFDPKPARMSFYYCKTCGSPDVEGQVWFRLNAQEAGEYSSDDTHCPRCEDEVRQVCLSVSGEDELDECIERAARWCGAYHENRHMLEALEHAQHLAGNKNRERAYAARYGITDTSSVYWSVFWAHITKTSGEGWVIVHGFTHDEDRCEDKAAWLENEGRGLVYNCMDPKSGFQDPQGFFKEYNIIPDDERRRTYTREQAMAMLEKKRSAGPWG